MNPFFNIEDLVELDMHEHAWYMDIKAKSQMKYILSCSSCDVTLFLGWWSLKTGHRYCVENMYHQSQEDLIIPMIMAKNIIFNT